MSLTSYQLTDVTYFCLLKCYFLNVKYSRDSEGGEAGFQHRSHDLGGQTDPPSVLWICCLCSHVYLTNCPVVLLQFYDSSLLSSQLRRMQEMLQMIKDKMQTQRDAY